MNLLGVHIDFNKHYTPEELEDLEAQLDMAFRAFASKMVFITGMLIITMCASAMAHMMMSKLLGLK